MDIGLIVEGLFWLFNCVVIEFIYLLSLYSVLGVLLLVLSFKNFGLS